ncbi:MAG: lipoyl synthase, partial [Aeromonas sp.]
KPIRIEPGVKLRDGDKMALIPVKFMPEPSEERLRKPDWMRIKLPPSSHKIEHIKNTLRKNNLHSVCEEASCPNLAECFNHGTATFMIMGAICTRRCPFCDVAHGRPLPLDPDEPQKMALTIKEMGLKYVVITSVDRDDLRDGGAQHFAECIKQIRKHSPQTRIEILTPDFRGRMEQALAVFRETPPDVFNHNLETAPRLYRVARPGADYRWSLTLLRRIKEMHPDVPTKSGVMMGLGETNEEIVQVLTDLREQGVNMLTLGQYLQPSRHHLPVTRYVPPAEFDELKEVAMGLGFTHAACGPFVRSSYHADLQAQGEEVK